MRDRQWVPFKDHHNFETYIDGCSFTNGISAIDGLKESTTEKSWAWNLPDQNKIFIGARAGKDNHSIFMDCMAAIHLKNIKRLIVFWTFPERYALPSDEDRYWINKAVMQPMRYNSESFWDYIYFQLIFMHQIQQACNEKNVEFTFLTTLPYVFYRRGNNGFLERIDHSRVINWPGYDANINDGCWANSLTTLFGVHYNCLGEDLKHLTREGEILFRDKIIMPFLEGKEIEQPWNTQEVFKYCETIPEDELEYQTGLTYSNLKKSVDYIYE